MRGGELFHNSIDTTPLVVAEGIDWFKGDFGKKETAIQEANPGKLFFLILRFFQLPELITKPCKLANRPVPHCRTLKDSVTF